MPVCASAFAAVFCEDLENKYLRYSIGRGNLKKYVLSKVIVIYVSSIITMILGTLLFIMYLRLQLPWTSDLATSSISGMYHAIRVGTAEMGLGQIGGIFFLLTDNGADNDCLYNPCVTAKSRMEQ